MSKENGDDLQNYNECQSIYWKLVKDFESGTNTNSTIFLKEFFKTASCDIYSDFSKDREKYEKHLGKEALRSILNNEETYEDEKRGAQAVLHYGQQTYKHLTLGLNFKNWLYYHTIHQPIKLAEFIAIGSSAYGGIRLASRTMASIKARYFADQRNAATNLKGKTNS